MGGGDNCLALLRAVVERAENRERALSHSDVLWGQF
jgi:hypothetical protein